MQLTIEPQARRTSTVLRILVVILLALATCQALFAQASTRSDDALFRESFDDARLPERGWYDGKTFAIAKEGAHSGEGCLAYHWKAGATTPESSSASRRLFPPTDTVYLRFFIKLSPGWGWSGQ